MLTQISIQMNLSFLLRTGRLKHCRGFVSEARGSGMFSGLLGAEVEIRRNYLSTLVRRTGSVSSSL